MGKKLNVVAAAEVEQKDTVENYGWVLVYTADKELVFGDHLYNELDFAIKDAKDTAESDGQEVLICEVVPRKRATPTVIITDI
jgi:hypothetical protein